MITECPTCNRRSIVCTHCGRLATDDNEGRLPRWCSGCGAMLAEPPAASRHESLLFAANEIVHSAMSGRMRPRTHLIVFAIVCGIVASVMTFGLLSPPKETPPGPRIYRETY